MTRRNMTILCILGAACAPALAQPEYVSFVGTPYDASNGGTVVVGGGGGGTFRWVRSGNTATVTILPSSVSSGRAHCSADGSVVVTEMVNGTSNPAFPPGTSFTGRWTEATGMVNLGHFLGGGVSGTTASTPFDCSADGNFACGLGYFGAGLTNFRGFRADFAGGTFVDLPQVGFNGSRANCISDDGLVVGGWDRNDTTSIDRPAVWRYDSGSSMWIETVLPTTENPADAGGTIESCNADGSVLAGRQFGPLSAQLVRWQWDGTQYNPTGYPFIRGTGVPATAGYAVSTMSGMSADGNVIIGSVQWRESINTFNRGFMWTPATGMVDLADYMVSQGIVGMPTGVTLGQPIGLSSDGTVITGSNGLGGGTWVIFRNGGVGCMLPAEVPSSSTTTISRCTTTVILNATVTGTGPFTYQWQRNGVNMVNGASGSGSTYANVTTSQCRITVADGDDVGSYTCIVTNTCGNITTTPINVGIFAAATNDTCATATEVVGPNNVAFEMCGAYTNEGSASCATSSTADVWYRFTSTFDGDLRITLCGTNPSNTVLSVFNGCGGTELACNNDYCSTQSQIDRLAVTSGQVLFVRLAIAATSFSNGTGVLSFLQAPPPPMNNNCATPEPIVSTVTNFDTTNATTDGSASCRSGSFKDLWYSYTAPRNGTININTCGSLFNTVLSLHGTCAGPELACNDNANVTGCTQQSAINNFRVRCGQSYLARVAGNATGVTGIGNVVLEFTPNTSCPADYNNDGLVSSQDFFDYLTDFFAQAPCADLDNTMDVTSSDFFAFITSFFNGC